MDQNIIHLARLHWILFVWPVLFFFAMLYVGLNVYPFHDVGLVLAFVGLVWAAMVSINYSVSSLTIKKNHVILRTGFLVQQTLDIPMTKIESIDIRQSILGSILQYGQLVITGTGGTRQYINYINKPLTCRRYIEQMLHEG